MRTLVLFIWMLLAMSISANAEVVTNATPAQTDAVEWITGGPPMDPRMYGYTGKVVHDIGSHRVPKMEYTNSILKIWSYYKGYQDWPADPLGYWGPQTGSTNGFMPHADVCINNGSIGLRLSTGEVYRNPTWLTPKDVMPKMPQYIVGQDYVYGGVHYPACTMMTNGTYLKTVAVSYTKEGGYFVWQFSIGEPITNVFFGSGVCGNAPMYAYFKPVVPTAAQLLSFNYMASKKRVVWQSGVEYNMIGYALFGLYPRENMVPLSSLIPARGGTVPAYYSVSTLATPIAFYLYEVDIWGHYNYLSHIVRRPIEFERMVQASESQSE